MQGKLKQVLSKVGSIYSQVDPYHDNTNRILSHTCDHLVSTILHLLSQLEQYVQSSFPTQYRPIQQYQQLQHQLQNKQAQIRQYIKLQHHQQLEQHSLRQKITVLEHQLQSVKKQNKNHPMLTKQRPKPRCNSIVAQVRNRQRGNSVMHALDQQSHHIHRNI